MSIYQDIILDHYHYPRNKGTLENPSNTVHLTNPLCGDVVDMQVIEAEGVVKNIAFDGHGCAITTASASLISEYAKGKTVKELKELDMQFMLDLLGIELSPNRLKCALLPLEALQKVL